ncbi:MAG: TetR/AcrR family transcriptional regulator, partial [Candidatus Obscuribacterales bacterium]|nr:TetR/AcrR family transcriptional regulator [Candidatus Obscuribacterales bacterium]
GQRIVDAFLERLMLQWFDEITLDSVAEDAGVTVQTVVRRFGGKEGLLSESVKTLAEQINACRQSPLGELNRIIESLFDDYEKTGDAVIRLLALESRHAAVKRITDFGRGEHRKWLATVFAKDLENLKSNKRELALDALVLVTDVYAWKLLRRDMQRSLAEARETMNLLIKASTAQLFNEKGDGQ